MNRVDQQEAYGAASAGTGERDLDYPGPAIAGARRRGATSSSMMQSQVLKLLARSALLVLALLMLYPGSAHAQRAGGPFERLAGQWAGSGTIDLSNGTHETLRCRASYDVLSERHNLQLNIRCASDSYNFDLFSSATLSGHSVSGSWSEATHSAAGTISGTADGDHIQVRAESPSFTANMSLVTRGDRQSVLIRSPDPNASVRGATINLRRRG